MDILHFPSSFLKTFKLCTVRTNLFQCFILTKKISRVLTRNNELNITLLKFKPNKFYILILVKIQEKKFPLLQHTVHFNYIYICFYIFHIFKLFITLFTRPFFYPQKIYLLLSFSTMFTFTRTINFYNFSKLSTHPML